MIHHETSKIGNIQVRERLSSQKAASAFLAVVLVVYLLAGVSLNVVLPLGEAPDEPAHFAYVRYVARNAALPVMQPRYEDNETVEGFQAPLYYVLAAAITFPAMGQEVDLHLNPAFSFSAPEPGIPTFLPLAEHRFPWRGSYLAWHVVRLFSLGLGAVTLWATYRAGLLTFGKRWLAAAAVAYLALNPQFIYVHSAVTNDTLATTAGSLITLAALLLLRVSATWSFGTAALAIALAALSKPSALTLCPGLALALWKAWRALPTKRARWLSLGLLIAVPAASSGWWFWRNRQLYGDWMGLNAAKQALSANYYPEPLSVRQLVDLLPRMLRQTFKTSWGVFGWISMPLPDWAFYGILAVHLAARTPNGVPLLPKTECPLPLRSPATLWPENEIVRERCPLHPSPDVQQTIGSLELYVMEGYPDAQPVPRVDSGEGTDNKVMLGQLIVGPVKERAPRGDRVAVFGEQEISLLGYALSPATVQPGGVLTVTLRWQAMRQPTASYHVFVHLLDQDGQLVTQQDSPPRAGTYPTSVWSAGEGVEDTHHLTIPPDYAGPLRPHIGLYEPASMVRLPVVDAQGIEYPSRALPLDQVAVER